MKFTFVLISILCSFQLLSQNTAITYELNGRLSNAEIQDSIKSSQNPFASFIGEWALKDNVWIQNWGGTTDTIEILNHHTVSAQINTDNSLISIIDGPEPNGHIFWSYNPNTKEVGHLSSFGTIRAGVGKGAFYDEMNLRLKINFAGEAEGTYRIYTYEWLNKNEYALKSVQYDANNEATGLFYQGNFIRIKAKENLEQQIRKILATLDDNQISKEEQVKIYTDDVIHMAPKNEVITSKKDLLKYLIQQKEYGYSDMKHEIVEFSDHGDIVIVRGQVKGIFYPSAGGNGFPFQTKNLIILTKVDNELKISKVIYNMSPNE